MGSKKVPSPVRKKRGAPNRPTRKRLSLSMVLLLATTFLFGFFVLWNVLPPDRDKPPEESLSELKNRLDKERSDRREELEEQLSEWQMKNEKLQREVERLKGE